MDYGPFLSYSVLPPAKSAKRTETKESDAKKEDGKKADPISDGKDTGTKPAAKTEEKYVDGFIAIKGISVHVGNNSTVCFDTDTLNLAAGWTGGFLDIRKTNLDNARGDTAASVPVPLQFGAGTGPGWAQGDSFADTRPRDGGPLPPEWAHYRGLYRNGQKVVFSYTVGKAEVLESDGTVATGGHVAFARTIRLGASAQPQRVNICELKGATGGVIPLATLAAAGATATGPANTSAAGLSLNGNDTLAAVVGAPAGAVLAVSEGSRVQLNLPALAAPAIFKIVIATVPGAHRAEFSDLLKSAATVEDPEPLCHGGPALWEKPVVTEGKLSSDTKSGYVVDTAKLPDDNPWKSWIRLSGVDFFPDGRAAVCTWNGDVWIVSGLDDTLGHVTWKRFAAGMYEPLGLKIYDNQIYVIGRDQITRLLDLNNDGEADFYENFCNAWPASPIYHAFNFDLQADSKGNFYFTTTGNQAFPWMRMKGDVIKVPKYGGTCEVLATGLRAPNGMGVGPNDEITTSDNQGNWTPVDRINIVKPGGFYGFVVDPRREVKGHPVPVPDHYDPPLCWIRYPKPDNSAGGQVWASKNWGPLSDHMLCTSYGQSDLMAVLQETVDGVAQGGVVKLPLKFDAGIMRGRVNPKDGQLWVCGLKGWQTNSAMESCLQRVRYTGKPANVPTALHILPAAISITFSDPLDQQLAADEQSYGIEEWNYHWTSTYGSPEFKLSDPKAKGHDEVPVKSVKVSPDRKTVTLETGPLKPVMQMAIEMHLKSGDGKDMEWEIDNTINKVP
jgi:glucose/arabinose dehydrogenase